jgi:rubrerythrin
MENIFSGSEVVEVGIQIENNGRDFYSTLSGQAQDSGAREMFKYLAGEEEKHIAAFQKILRKASGYQPQGLTSDEYYAYMNALAGEYVFTQKDKGEEIARNIKSDREAVDKGIVFEKDSIIFYEGIKHLVPSNDAKVIDELIIQEKKHLKKLIDLKQKR